MVRFKRVRGYKAKGKRPTRPHPRRVPKEDIELAKQRYRRQVARQTQIREEAKKQMSAKKSEESRY